TASACTGTLHLLVGNDWGGFVQDMSITDECGNSLLSGASLPGGEGVYYDLTVTAGKHYFFHCHDYDFNLDFNLDFVPTKQNGLIDIYSASGLMIWYEESGNDLCSPMALPTVSVTTAWADAYESPEDPAIFTVTRVASDISAPLTVNLQASGTATPGTDYPAI